MDDEKFDVSSVYGSMNIHAVYQQNSLKHFMKYNDRDDIKINSILYNGDVSSQVCLINRHTLYQFNQ